MTNVGFSVGLYKRVMVDFEFYNNVTTDMLTESRVSSIISEDAVMRNVGKMRNRGYEITITSANIVHKDFSWQTELNIAHNQNKILTLFEGITKSFGERVWAEGRSKNEWCLIRWAGIDLPTASPCGTTNAAMSPKSTTTTIAFRTGERPIRLFSAV